MKHTVAQFGILAALALAVPMTAPGHTSHTAELQNASTSPVKPGTVPAEKKSTATVSVVASNLPLARIAAQLEHQSGVPISLKGTTAEMKVTVVAPKGQTVYEILKQIVDADPKLLLKQAMFNTKGQETVGYEIWENSDYEKSAAVVKVYQIKEAEATKLGKFIEPIISINTGTVIADARLNKLVVRDTPEKQGEVEKLIEELDKKLLTRVFALRHRNATEVANHISRFFSLPTDQVVADVETGQIAVKGTTETIQGVEKLVEAFDVLPLSKRDESTTSP